MVGRTRWSSARPGRQVCGRLLPVDTWFGGRRWSYMAGFIARTVQSPRGASTGREGNSTQHVGQSTNGTGPQGAAQPPHTEQRLWGSGWPCCVAHGFLLTQMVAAAPAPPPPRGISCLHGAHQAHVRRPGGPEGCDPPLGPHLPSPSGWKGGGRKGPGGPGVTGRVRSLVAQLGFVVQACGSPSPPRKPLLCHFPPSPAQPVRAANAAR